MKTPDANNKVAQTFLSVSPLTFFKKYGTDRNVCSTFAAAVLLLAGCSRHDAESGSVATPALPAVRVRVAEVRVLDEMRRVELPATVRAVESAQLAPKIMGAVESIPVTLGQGVRRGDVLAKISAGEINAKLAQAETGLAQATRDLERERALLAKEASTAETVRNLEDRQRIAQAQVDEARVMLGYTTIVAPFDGVVIQKFANEGDLAAPGRPLLAIENPARLRVETDVPESLGRLALGADVPVKIGGAARGTQETQGTQATQATAQTDQTDQSDQSDQSNQPAESAGEFRGRLAEVAPTSDSATRTFTAKIDLPAGADASAGVHPGQFARVSWPAGGERNVSLVVPAAAVTLFGQMERVFVAGGDGRASLRLVKTGARRGDMVEILAGLSAGEKVVVEGAQTLRDGQPLEVTQ